MSDHIPIETPPLDEIEQAYRTHGWEWITDNYTTTGLNDEVTGACASGICYLMQTGQTEDAYPDDEEILYELGWTPEFLAGVIAGNDGGLPSLHDRVDPNYMDGYRFGTAVRERMQREGE